MAFDSREFAWADVQVSMMGKLVTKIRSVKYKSSQEKEALYAAGNKPVAVQPGNKSYSGSISLLQSEFIALQNAAGTTYDVTDLPPFDITVSYLIAGAKTPHIKQIKMCEFTDAEEGMSQNDKFMTIELPFIALDVITKF